MRELDLSVAPEFLVLRRLLQTRVPSARTELAMRAAAGDRLVVDQPIDLQKLLDVVREFQRIERECEPPDVDAEAKLAIVERELVQILRAESDGGARGSAS